MRQSMATRHRPEWKSKIKRLNLKIKITKKPHYYGWAPHNPVVVSRHRPAALGQKLSVSSLIRQMPAVPASLLATIKGCISTLEDGVGDG